VSASRPSTRWLHSASSSHAVAHPRRSAPERYAFGGSDRVNGRSGHTAVANGRPGPQR